MTMYYRGHIERIRMDVCNLDRMEVILGMPWLAAHNPEIDWGREEEMEIDHHKIETMVPEQFHWWLKVFGKVESERMLVKKVWDHAIDVKENFMLASD